MAIDFDKIIDRSGTGSEKWDARKAVFGTEDVVPLWVADMDFAAAEPITEALVKRAAHPFYGYTLSTDSVFDSLIQWLKKRHHWNVEKKSIALMPGVIPTLYTAIHAFTNPGEGVIAQTPVYPQFFAAVRNLERRLIVNPLRLEGLRYTIDFDHLEQCAADGAKLLILCSPHNPVGRVWKEEELRGILGICRRRGVAIISDEIFQDLIYPGFRHIPLATLAEENDVVVTSVSPSKSFNISGIDLAAIIAKNPDHLAAMRRAAGLLRCDLSGDANPFSLVAFETAYRCGETWIDALMPYVSKTQADVATYFAAHAPQIAVVPPESTYLLWLDCRKMGMSDEQLRKFFTMQAKVGLSPGISFGEVGSGFMRMNIGAPRAIIEKALGQIGTAMSAKQ